MPMPESISTAWGLYRNTTATSNVTPYSTIPSSSSIISSFFASPHSRVRDLLQWKAGTFLFQTNLTIYLLMPHLSQEEHLFFVQAPSIELLIIGQTTLAIERAVITAFEVTPPHIIRAHIRLTFSHHHTFQPQLKATFLLLTTFNSMTSNGIPNWQKMILFLFCFR